MGLGYSTHGRPQIVQQLTSAEGSKDSMLKRFQLDELSMAKQDTMIVSHHTKVCFLLCTFTFFWTWQIVQPVLDEYLPLIHIGHNSTGLPVSEIISQYLGACTILSGYTLFYAVSNGYLTFVMNSAFILAAFMLASGHGVHVACVTIQKQMSNDNLLYELVFFLHEHWSHNMFLIGFYSLIILLIWAERNGTMQRPQRTAPHCHNNIVPLKSSAHIRIQYSTLSDLDCDKGHPPTSVPTAKSTTNKHICCHGTVGQECIGRQQLSSLSQLHWSHTKSTSVADIDERTISTHQKTQIDSDHNHIMNGKSPSDLEPMLLKSLCKTSIVGCVDDVDTKLLFARLIVTWTTRVWPIFVGVYFSAFASMTTTKPLTTLFYFVVLSSQMTLYKKHSFARLSDYLRLCDDDMVISGFFTKAVLVGLPLMLLDFE